MIVALDLDDTLYPEATFVHSGFRAVARALHQRWGTDEQEALEEMQRSLEESGRGSQFDDVVAHLGLRRRQSVAELVRVYRHHPPSIELPEESRRALAKLAPRPLYLVTDGHKVVQQAKVDALGIRPFFRHAYLTHRYGTANRKPSPRVFELIMRRERCASGDLVYVGDDPAKDFLGIRPLGIHTIRVLSGRHAGVEVPEAQDAERTVNTIDEVPTAVAELETASR
ncbi:MAG: HAD family hydrolase [Actinomycetota bacterium]|nr:HAD family hydrolase [Actinomycetota bacterium]